jgi:N-acetylglucosaminyldiphosphoundecaprenol N-acetyl-beta-D-mannosaminyltransferase
MRSVTAAEPHSDLAAATIAVAVRPAERVDRVLDRVRIGGLSVDNTTIDDAAAFAIERARQRRRLGSALLATVNARSVLLAADSPRFGEILNHSALSIPDGMSIVLASRLLGTPLRERVTGVDLVEELCKRCAREKLSVYFLGGRPGAADRTAAVLRERYPGLRLAGTDCPPNDFERDPLERARVLQAIRKAGPDILFVALGMPKQEFWIAESASALEVGVVMPVGGTFELLAGLIPRAPRWLQRLGLEWLFRLIVEPRRLWRRYLIGNARFIALIVRQYFNRSSD